MNILCLDIGGTFVKIGLINENAKFVFQNEFPTNANMGADQLIKEIMNYIDNNIVVPFQKIGISSAGQINTHKGIVAFASDNIPGYTNYPLRLTFEEHFKVPVVVENDVNACGIGEAHFGKGRDYKDFICLAIGTGIGGAIIINRSIYYGTSYGAGEFGHILTHPNGKMCTCGKKGCFEQYASTKALISMVYEKTSLSLNGKQIFTMLSNHVIRNIVNEWVFELCYGIVSLIYTFNPSCIILGGGIMEQNYIFAEVNKVLPTLITKNYQHVRILKAELGNSAAMMGVYYLANAKSYLNH